MAVHLKKQKAGDIIETFTDADLELLTKAPFQAESLEQAERSVDFFSCELR